MRNWLVIVRHWLRRMNESASLPGIHVPWPLDVPVHKGPVVGLNEFVARLDGLLEPSFKTRVCAVVGSSGMGKTTLIAHWAAVAERRFAGRFLYLDLNATSGEGPIEGLLTEILRQAGVSAATIKEAGPAGLEKLFRAESRGRHWVLIVENAKTVDQVLKLLPGAGSVLVVTSRVPLPGLAELCSDTIELEPLEFADAKQLLDEVVGGSRVPEKSAETEALVRQCAGRPLALLLVGSLLRADPGLLLHDLTGALAGRRKCSPNGVDEAIGPVIDLCYGRLDANAKQVFRSLGSWPLPPLPPGAVAALADLRPDVVPDALYALRELQLIRSDRHGRVYLHDVLRSYAASLGQDREGARNRLLRWYESSAEAGGNALADGWAGEVKADKEGIHPQTFSADRPDLVLNWCARELPTVVALLRDFGRSEPRSWRLALFFTPFLYLRKPQAECLELAQLGLGIARGARDELGEGRCLHMFAWVEHELQQDEPAAEHLEEAHLLQAKNKDDRGLAWTAFAYGQSFAEEGRFAESEKAFRVALDHFRATGLVFGVAIVQATRAITLDKAGQHDAALRAGHEALYIAVELESIPLQGLARHQLGHLRQRNKDYRGAVDEFEAALSFRRRSGERWGEAETLYRQGLAFTSLGDHRNARAVLTESLGIFEELHDHGRAGWVKVALAALDLASRPRPSDS